MAQATWIGTVTFRDSRRWLAPITIKVDASNPRIAVKAAASAATLRLPKGTRVQGVCVKLERVAAPRKPKAESVSPEEQATFTAAVAAQNARARHVTTDACRSYGCPKCKEQMDRDEDTGAESTPSTGGGA